MKRNSILNSIALSVALSAFLTGCGSSGTTNGSNDNPNNNSVATTTIDGKAVDGYLQYATVCLDLSQDGYCQNSEPSTQTDENGTFRLKIDQQAHENPNFDTAMLLVYGGKDVDTGDDFTGKLLAPKDGSTVMLTPVTTLVAKQLQKELKAEQKLSREEIKAKIKAAKERVAQALDLPVDALEKDPVEEQRKGNDDLINKSLQLQKAVEALLAAEPDKAKRNDRAEQIYEALADALEEMDPQNRGIGQLLDKTMEKAGQDEKVRELLGGERGLKLGHAAKRVAQNIEEGFKKFDEESKKDQDFLKKIALISKEDLKKVEVAVEEGKEDEIAGQITIDDGIFKPDFDWSQKFLAHDLERIGIEPTPDLIAKIKNLLGDEEIEPGTLFKKAERLKGNEDAQIAAVYRKISQFFDQKEAEEAEHEAIVSGEIIPFDKEMAFYFAEDEDGYGQATFTADGKLLFQKFKVQQDGTFAPENDDDEDHDIILVNGKWVAGDDTDTFRRNADGTITLEKWNEHATLLKGKPIAGTTLPAPGFDLPVSMPENAEMYLLKIEKLSDTYNLYSPEYRYSPEGKEPVASISDFIESQCGNHWFAGDRNGGIAFAGTLSDTGEYVCDATATKGELVHAYNSDEGTKIDEKIAGEWEIKNVSGHDILIVKPYDTDRVKDHDGGIRYPIFSIYNGTLYRGDLEPKGPVKIIPAYNKAAIDAITSTITQNWGKLKDMMPKYETGE